MIVVVVWFRLEGIDIEKERENEVYIGDGWCSKRSWQRGHC